jgi:hypothetical protein
MRIGRAVGVGLALTTGLAGGGAMGFMAKAPPVVPGISLQRFDPGLLVPDDDRETPEPTATHPVVQDTLLAWTPGGLPDGLAQDVAELRDVRRVVTVVSGVVWIYGSFDADGTPVDRAPDGYMIPLEVAGADLGAYEPFLSPGDRPVLSRLAHGEAALGSSSAGLRRLDQGGVLDLGARTVRVAGVLPDAAIGAHEAFVSRATAESLGIRVDRYLLVDPVDGASLPDLTDRIRSLLPPGVAVRVRGPGETPYFRQGDAVLPPIRLKEVFGEFAARPTAGGYLAMDPSWERSHIVTASVPVLGRVRCNRALLPMLVGALKELEGLGLGHLIDPAGYAGCYSPRFINRVPTAGISHHAWGVALDVNVPENPFGHTPHQDPRLVAIFDRWGFTWGGTWIRPDGMHFEFVEFPTGT